MVDNSLHLKVAGTGIYLPKEVRVNNYFLERQLKRIGPNDETLEVFPPGTVDEDYIFCRSGIKSRHIADDEMPSDMGYQAARMALDFSGLKADSLVGIIVGTLTENSDFPNCAQKIQRKLGTRNCFAYDIIYACAAFPEALIQANTRVLRHPGNYLVVASERTTSMVDEDDLNSFLFSDGAGAFVLTPTTESVGILDEFSRSDPFDGKSEWVFRNKNRRLRLIEGKALMKGGILSMCETTSILIENLGWDEFGITIVPHQANIRMTNGVTYKMPKYTVCNYIESLGNPSAASIPISTHFGIRDNLIRYSIPKNIGTKAILTAVGGGLSEAAVAIQF